MSNMFVGSRGQHKKQKINIIIITFSEFLLLVSLTFSSYIYPLNDAAPILLIYNE